MRPRVPTVLFLLAAAAGLFFAGFSTYDFVQHLDRQVHGIHCSWVPGLEQADISGSTGCHVTLMSPYSAVFRTLVWGGIPISLPGMAVFAFLLFRGLDLWLNRREEEGRVWTLLLLASAIPLATSAGMAWIAFTKLDAACKLCIGIYLSSIGVFGAALAGWASGRKAPEAVDPGLAIPLDAPASGLDLRETAFGAGQAAAFVAVPALVYLIAQPDQDAFIGTCGTLPKPEDSYKIMIPYEEGAGGVPTIEVFDPLCASCKGTEERLQASGLAAKLDRKLVLFPLDNSCNKSIGSTLHPGACAISEAVLCAGEKADLVVDWAFENQEAIRVAAAADPAAAAKLATDKFPELKSCVGSPAVKSRLNQSLRWAIANRIELLTPQIFVDGVKLCNEDTDLGLDYALTRMLEAREKGQLGGAK